MLSAKFRRNTPCGSREKVDLIGFANLLTAASLNSQSGCFFFFFFFFFYFSFRSPQSYAACEIYHICSVNLNRLKC